MGEAPNTRRWWRWNWLTCVLVCCVAGSVVLENLAGQFSPDGSAFFNGWPENFLVRWSFISEENLPLTPASRLPIDNFEDIGFGYRPLLTNTLIALAIFASTAFTTETYLRRQPRWQFSIQSIILFTTFVALLLTNIKYDFIRWQGDALWEYIPFFFICLGLWCVFWAAWRLIGLGVGRIGGGDRG